MKIQAVFFDMGGTIDTFSFTPELRLSRTPGIQKRLLDAGIDLGYSNQELYSVVSDGLARYKSWSMVSEEELSPARVWSEYIFPDYPIDFASLASISEDLMCYVEMRYFDRKVRPEVPAVLAKVKNLGFKIGLISNVCSRGQVPLNLKEYGLIHYFDPIILSSEFGYRKPDPSIFHYAATLAGVPTSQCLHIGDRITRDILGAKRAGFGLNVQVKHKYNHQEAACGAVPDYLINDLTELVEILESITDSTKLTRHPASKSTNHIKALIFDAGDILYRRNQKGRYLKEFLNGLNLSLNGNHKSEHNELRQQAFRGEIFQKEYQIALLRSYGVNQQEHLIQGLAAIRKDEDNVQFFNEVRETLVALKDKGFLLGVLTDTANSIHTKLSWFERGGIGHIWDSFTSSLVVGVRKPDSRMYQAALDQLGVTPGEAVFIGHKKSELDGAKAVGLKTIAFNYDRDVEADYFIENFADMLEVPLLS